MDFMMMHVSAILLYHRRIIIIDLVNC